jgi:hypothetical protein
MTQKAEGTGYALNLKRRPGDGRGIFSYSLDFTDGFR